jgi:hypothetical protein
MIPTISVMVHTNVSPIMHPHVQLSLKWSIASCKFTGSIINDKR